MATSVHTSSRLTDGVGTITLDRPEALNALNTTMIRSIHDALDAWESHPLDAVIIKSADPKYFCSGGDIKSIRKQVLEGNVEASEDFFVTEYKLNSRLATYSAPVVSLISGACMGGGVGLSIHGKFRIVTQSAVLAMPETAIGFFPDVGASYFLSRLPGSLGMYLALTGHRMDYRDALYCGAATHYVPEHILSEIPELLRQRQGQPVAQTLSTLSGRKHGTEGHLAEYRSEIDWCFSAPSLAEIRDRLHEVDNAWSRDAGESMDRSSPQSLETTLGLLRWGAQLSLDECLRMEFRMARIAIRSNDFIEGVRATLVDKDRRPSWSQEPAQPLELMWQPA